MLVVWHVGRAGCHRYNNGNRFMEDLTKRKEMRKKKAAQDRYLGDSSNNWKLMEFEFFS